MSVLLRYQNSTKRLGVVQSGNHYHSRQEIANYLRIWRYTIITRSLMKSEAKHGD